ncbi:MAG: S49 family peptidase [Gammaproteobacteria bacterium]|nr:S49 family peptidase [Gammaproteobacteria bacterium]
MSDNATENSNYQAIVERLSFAAINEQRRSRRWKIFFTILVFLYLTPFLLLTLEMSDIHVLDKDKLSTGKHAAVVKLEGVIATAEEASAESVIEGLKAAFKDKDTAGVILTINSPGGSPVQSAYIYDEMVRLQEKNPGIPLHVVITDMAASGGYFVASAAKNIYVNKSSIVGSIGVRMDSFGFVGLIEKLGIERRLLTAGEHKGLLDPFQPENLEQKAHLKNMLAEVHQHFKQAVIDGRKGRLKTEEDLFTGLIWTGEHAIKLGLADGYGSVQSIAKNEFDTDEVKDFTTEEKLFDRLITKISVAVAKQVSLLANKNINLF